MSRNRVCNLEMFSTVLRHVNIPLRCYTHQSDERLGCPKKIKIWWVGQFLRGNINFYAHEYGEIYSSILEQERIKTVINWLRNLEISVAFNKAAYQIVSLIVQSRPREQ